MDNLKFYKAFGSTPKEAQKTIAAGKLKGMTDINPMWRIKALTEKFGPQGLGWKIEVVDMWTTGNNDNSEVAAWCRVNLFYRDELSGDWSAPVPGIGGSKLFGKGVGEGINDEAYKMAYTDAIAIACKGLGMSADIYFAKDRTKYDLASSASVPAAAQDDIPEAPKVVKQYRTDPVSAEIEFAACKNIDEIKKLYNEEYGGNAHATTEIKRICSAAVTRLS